MYDTNNNITGIIGLLQQIVASPTTSNSLSLAIIFPSMTIILIWAILSLGSFFAMTRRYGTSQFMDSLVIGGFVANIIGGLLMIIPNFMPMRVMVISVIIEIIFFLIFISEKNTKND